MQTAKLAIASLALLAGVSAQTAPITTTTGVRTVSQPLPTNYASYPTVYGGAGVVSGYPTTAAYGSAYGAYPTTYASTYGSTYGSVGTYPYATAAPVTTAYSAASAYPYTTAAYGYGSTSAYPYYGASTYGASAYPYYGTSTYGASTYPYTTAASTYPYTAAASTYPYTAATSSYPYYGASTYPYSAYGAQTYPYGYGSTGYGAYPYGYGAGVGAGVGAGSSVGTACQVYNAAGALSSGKFGFTGLGVLQCIPDSTAAAATGTTGTVNVPTAGFTATKASCTPLAQLTASQVITCAAAGLLTV